MLGFDWGSWRRANAGHPMSEGRDVAKLLEDLPLATPGKAVAEAAAWLESVELEPTFTLAHRLRVVAMIDEAVRASVQQVRRDYVGAGAGDSADGVACWRLLCDYLDKLGRGYAKGLDALEERPEPELAQRLPLFLSRTMRSVTDRMAVGWMRYLPPDHGSWESLVQAYRIAASRNLVATLVQAYEADPETTCAGYEFAAAVMFAAAAPDALPPRQIELAHRIASRYASAFECSAVHDERCQFYMDLDRPGPPVRVLADFEISGAMICFGARGVGLKLGALIDEAGKASPGTRAQFGDDFGRSETLAALTHTTAFWSDSPPVRREHRTHVESFIWVTVGVRGLQAALAFTDKREASDQWALVPDEGVAAPANADQGRDPAALDKWTLTDFSPRGISARLSHRPAGHVGIGTVFGFRLERSAHWGVAIVRRMRRDGRGHTDIGAEILAKGAELVSLELESDATAPQSAWNAALVHSRAVLLPEAPALKNAPSLFFEPATNRPGQVCLLRGGQGVRRIRLGPTLECLDGWDRVSFEWLP